MTVKKILIIYWLSDKMINIFLLNKIVKNVFNNYYKKIQFQILLYLMLKKSISKLEKYILILT